MGANQAKSAEDSTTTPSQNTNGGDKSKPEMSKFFEKSKTASTEDAPDVDLCFMFDCTGSMGSYIDMARRKIKDIITKVKDTYPTSQVRIGVVAYRDVQDSNRFEILTFTDSVEKAKSFLDKLVASGGGDTPEDINGAFQKCLFKMEWKNPVRMLVHVADAPCHGKNFHDYDDSYPEGHQEDMDWNKIFKALVEKRLDYLLLKITNQTDKMFDKFKILAEEHGFSRNELNFDQEVVYDSGAVSSTEMAKGMAFKAEAFAEVENNHYDCESDKVQALCDAHFTETIAQKVRSKVNYVQNNSK